METGRRVRDTFTKLLRGVISQLED